MSWVEYFQNATRLVNKKVNSKAMIVNFAPEYFEKLARVVQEYNKTDDGKTYEFFFSSVDRIHRFFGAEEYALRINNCNVYFDRVLNNYLVWQTVRSLTAFLSKPFREAYKGLRKALIGSEGREEQWRYCVSDANNVMGFAIGSMFVREVFNGESKTKVRFFFSSP